MDRDEYKKVNCLYYHTRLQNILVQYRYLEHGVQTPEMVDRIYNAEFEKSIEAMNSVLKDPSENGKRSFRSQFEGYFRDFIVQSLSDSVINIRSSLFVSAFSVFESFLEHVVHVYFNHFPELYNRERIKLSLNDIEGEYKRFDMKTLMMLKAVENFTNKSFQDQIAFFKNKLKLRRENIWDQNGEELVFRIYHFRNYIVHRAPENEISDEQFLEFVTYLASLVFRISAYTQADHGIEFMWLKDTNINIMMKEKPVL